MKAEGSIIASARNVAFAVAWVVALVALGGAGMLAARAAMVPGAEVPVFAPLNPAPVAPTEPVAATEAPAVAPLAAVFGVPEPEPEPMVALPADEPMPVDEPAVSLFDPSIFALRGLLVDGDNALAVLETPEGTMIVRPGMELPGGGRVAMITEIGLEVEADDVFHLIEVSELPTDERARRTPVRPSARFGAGDGGEGGWLDLGDVDDAGGVTINVPGGWISPDGMLRADDPWANEVLADETSVDGAGADGN